MKLIVGILDIARNFKDIKTTSRLEIIGQEQSLPLGKRKNSHDAFVNLGSALEIAVRSRKPRAVALVKRLGRKGVEKLQEEHQMQTEEKDAAIPLLNDDLENVSKQLVDLEHNKL